MVHAGLPAEWDIPTALQRAREVESVLQGNGFHDFCMQMYGNKPNRWSDTLKGMDRIRYIVNCFTRMRYCEPDGSLDERGVRERAAIALGSPGSHPSQTDGEGSQEQSDR